MVLHGKNYANQHEIPIVEPTFGKLSTLLDSPGLPGGNRVN
jgi:hypothetical protein